MDIKLLKDKILQLAIQGKLVPQDENDEPASVLLEKIRAEKEQLIKDKVIKKDKSLPDIKEEEKFIELPKGWEWTKIQKIAFVTKLAGFEYTKNIAPNLDDNGTVKLLKGKNIRNGNIILECEDKINLDVSLELQRSALTKKCLLTPFVGTLGNVAIFNEKERYHLGANVAKIELFNNFELKILEEYIKYYLLSIYGEKELTKHSKSTAQSSISMEAIRDTIVLIPPLEEQKRIVAKVDELFELIDELDNNKQELLDSISNTRNKVLQLAIQGKLVEQCEDDEPASVLLERIKAEKEQLIKDKVIKKEKSLPEISEEEKVFDLPKGWEWCRFGRATICRDGERVPVSSKERQDRAKIYDYYGASGVIDKIDDYLFDIPLLLIGEDGANLISRSTPIAFIAKGKYWVNNHAHVIDSTNLATLKYLEVYLNAIDLKPYVTGTAQPKLNQANLNKIPISLPPLGEQKRIVAKVELIMNYLDTLKQEIESQEVILENILK